MPVFLDQPEAGALIEFARRNEHVVGPQNHAPVTTAARLLDTLLDQPRTDAMASRSFFDVQHAQFRRSFIIIVDEKDRSYRLATQLGDPAEIKSGLEVADEGGANLRQQGLELDVPAILFRIKPRLPLHNPADVADAMRAQRN
jgi:hypothetical protein